MPDIRSSINACIMTLPRYLLLERSVVLLITLVGIVLLMLAFSMIEMSQYNVFHQYVRARRIFTLRNTDILSEENIGNTTRLFAKVTDPPVTDPPWMDITPEPLGSFRPMDRHPFLRDNVIASPDICRNTSVDLLIVIHSKAHHFQRRRILRETWAALDTIEGLTVKRVFGLGRNQSSSLTQILINSEQAVFGDIVQGDFQDSFHNLTLKAVTMLRWINDHCLHASFILKTDDDAFVNVFSLAEKHLQRLAGQRRTVMCMAKRDQSSIIVRDPRSKWYVPPSLMAGRTHWPAFCSGFVVIMTPDNIPALYEASFTVPYVPVDDAYVYGLLPLGAQNYTLHYVDISGDVELADGRLMAHYQKLSTFSRLAGLALSDAAFLKLWQKTVEGLSAWGKLRASLPRLQVNTSAIHF